MPYIITTNTRGYYCMHCGLPGTCPNDAHARITRRAVATLEELEARLYNEAAGIHGESYEPLCATIEDLCLRLDSGEESGGTIGPLPDGTVIEVAPIGWMDLAGKIPAPGAAAGDPLYAGTTLAETLRPDVYESNRAEVLAAFNQETAR